MLEPQDNGESPLMKIATMLIALTLFLIVFQLDAIYRALKATPKEFIQQFDKYIQTEKNP